MSGVIDYETPYLRSGNRRSYYGGRMRHVAMMLGTHYCNKPPIRGCRETHNKKYELCFETQAIPYIYAAGFRYCSTCVFFTRTDDKFCQCCGLQFRRRTRGRNNIKNKGVARY